MQKYSLLTSVDLQFKLVNGANLLKPLKVTLTGMNNVACDFDIEDLESFGFNEL